VLFFELCTCFLVYLRKNVWLYYIEALAKLISTKKEDVWMIPSDSLHFYFYGTSTQQQLLAVGLITQ
jgi:hypothetical protein